jgi:hypothetical protein
MAINYRSHFAYRIDAWDADGENVIEHLAGVEDLQVACGMISCFSRKKLDDFLIFPNPPSRGPDYRHDGNQLAPGALGTQPAAHFPPPVLGRLPRA